MLDVRIVNEDLIVNGPGFLSLWGRDNSMSGEPRGGYLIVKGLELHFALERGCPLLTVIRENGPRAKAAHA